MLFTTNYNSNITNSEIESINDFINEFDADIAPISNDIDTEEAPSSVAKYLTSLVSSHYQKAVQDIENTNTNSRIVRKRNLQQVMRESFFYGANRFGNNFIA